jgi:RNA recognition motif-containing protein
MEFTNAPQSPVKHKISGMSICVKNLPTFADDLWMYRRFSQFGAIHSVRAMMSPETAQCMGLGFVNFIHPTDGQSAIANMNGAMVDGKRLVVEMQRPRRKPVAAPTVVVESNGEVEPTDD